VARFQFAGLGYVPVRGALLKGAAVDASGLGAPAAGIESSARDRVEAQLAGRDPLRAGTLWSVEGVPSRLGCDATLVAVGTASSGDVHLAIQSLKFIDGAPILDWDSGS